MTTPPVSPPAGTTTYTFTAGRPGTFLYEAGHTADGARQVAMGLAGALVVLPGDGTAYGTPPATRHATTTRPSLVLSEIDPALNANPATFDMRDFAPGYRLINGKPFPATDPVATDQGHKVLLRYVNAGSQTHAMTVLGGEQVEIAQDGHPLTTPTPVAAESVDPGQTAGHARDDADRARRRSSRVYERGRHLDNNGQHTADPLQIAFGGMMTFLDTAAPAAQHRRRRSGRPRTSRSPEPVRRAGARDRHGRPQRRDDRRIAT